MFNYLLYRMGQFLVLHLPRRLGYALAVFLSDLHYLFSFRDRRMVRNNLQVILNSEQDLHIYTRQVFRSFGKYLVDFFRMAILDKNNLDKTITVENIHYIDNELKKGNGVILVSGHLGNWELGGVAMAILGYPILVVALEHRSPSVNNLFNAQRKIQGVEVVQIKNAGRKCLEALKNNMTLALVMDRDFSGNGMVTKFFGKDTLIPKGPAVFARRTNAAIVPGFIIRQPDDRFKLIFEKPILPIVTDNEAADLAAITQRCLSVIEDYVRRYPTQWLVFRQFWTK